MRTIVAMTGASGALVAVEFLKKCPGEKILIVSRWGKSILHQETGLALTDLEPYVSHIFSNDDMMAPVASGSVPFDRYVIVPCSMTTLGRLANGLGENLIARVGEVALKENRRMLLGLREAPLSAVALENALKLARLGVTIMPLTPPFYLKMKSLADAASALADHMLASLGTPTTSGWREDVLNKPSETSL